jgi:hypothetical protein
LRELGSGRKALLKINKKNTNLLISSKDGIF